MIRFVLALLLTSLVIVAATALLFMGGIIHAYPSFFWQSLFLVSFSTLVIYYYLVRKGKDVFIQLYLLTIVVKLLAFCSYNILIILQDKENAGINVGFFMISYFIFTTIELVFLYRRIGR